MIQEHYGKYIRDDGAALLRAYVEQPKQHAKERKTGTFGGNFSGKNSNYWNNLASPTGFEPARPKRKKLTKNSNVHGVAKLFPIRSEEHTSELQSLRHLVCRLLLEKKNK